MTLKVTERFLVGVSGPSGLAAREEPSPSESSSPRSDTERRRARVTWPGSPSRYSGSQGLA